MEYFDLLDAKSGITPVFRNEEIMQRIRERNPQGVSLPDSEKKYTMPVVFPGPYEDRPYIVSSIVLSADGKMAFHDKKEGPLIARNNFLDPRGAGADFWCLNMLRAYADGILIGANTLRNEPDCVCYCMDASLAEQRSTVLNKKMQPVQIIVSLDGTDIPFDHRIFRISKEENMIVMVATSPDGYRYMKEHSILPFFCADPEAVFETPDGAFPVLVTGYDSEPDTKEMLQYLRRAGLALLCAESPTYTGALMKKACLDEYFINYSMVFAGGGFSPNAVFPFEAEAHPHALVAGVGMHGSSFLFTRLLMQYGITKS